MEKEDGARVVQPDLISNAFINLYNSYVHQLNGSVVLLIDNLFIPESLAEIKVTKLISIFRI